MDVVPAYPLEPEPFSVFCVVKEIRVVVIVMRLPLRNRNAQFIDRSMKQKEPLFVTRPPSGPPCCVVLGPPGMTELPPESRVEQESRDASEGGGRPALSRRFA